jgi:uncharacterized protein
VPGFERSWPSWPIPGTGTTTFYLSGNGKLRHKSPPAEAVFNSFTADAHARPLTNFTGDTAAGTGGLWTATPPYQWSQNPPGKAVSYITNPIKRNKTVIGGGAVYVYVKSSTPNVDLQATISEVRPDGKETFVQGGWVRANERKLDASKSTPLEPVLSLRAADVQPMPSHVWVEVPIPLYYQGHVYRTGSRIRLTISAPNGDQPIWSFGETEPAGTSELSIANTRMTPSRLVLPIVRDMPVPTGLPPCPGLRGEPCRDYQAFTNRPG